MIKAKNIINIKKEHEKYKKLYENETDIVKRMKYGRRFRDHEDKLMDIELQLLNIELGLFRDIELHKNVFIEQLYIKFVIKLRVCLRVIDGEFKMICLYLVYRHL